MNKHIQKLNFGLDCMMVLLTLILLWSAEAIGMLGVLLLPLMVLPASVLTEENRYAALLFNTVLPAVLILFLPFPHFAWFGFVAVIGWYAPVRALLSRIRMEWFGNLLAFLLANAGIAIGFFVLFLIGVQPFSGLDPFWLVLVIIGIELEILLTEIIYQIFGNLYQTHLRRFLLV